MAGNSSKSVVPPTNQFNCHTIIDIAEMFLDEELEKISFSRIADIMRQICSARVVIFNLYQEDGRKYRTMALSAEMEDTRQIKAVLGFDVVGHVWDFNPAKGQGVSGSTMKVFESLVGITGDRIDREKIGILETELELGKVHLAIIRKENRIIGDFLLILGKKQEFINEGLVLLYSKLVGLFISRRKAEEMVQISHERYMLAVRGNRDGIWDWDISSGDLFLSERWKEMLGYQDSEIPNKIESFQDNLHPEDQPRVMEYVGNYLQGQFRHYNIEFRMRHKDGSYRWILARGEAIYDGTGIPRRMAGSHTDITEKKDFEKRLELAASTDCLTGLLNRRSFFDMGCREVARSKRYRTPWSLLMLDLDHFKRINDSYGHSAGDEVIRCMADLLRSGLRDVDLPARLGGEEFAVLLPNTPPSGALVAAERLRQSVESSHVTGDSGEIRFTVSIGIAGDDGGQELEKVLQWADEALYKAKNAGRNRCELANLSGPTSPDAV